MYLYMFDVEKKACRGRHVLSTYIVLIKTDSSDFSWLLCRRQIVTKLLTVGLVADEHGPPQISNWKGFGILGRRACKSVPKIRAGISSAARNDVSFDDNMVLPTMISVEPRG